MNIRIFFVTILVALALHPAGANQPLSDCAPVGVVSAALKSISDSDWVQVSATELRAMWPEELGAIDCNGDSCTVKRREEPTISDKCQCCEIFHFNADGGEKGAATKQRLHSIVLYYSEPRREDALKAAKALAQSFGLAG